LKRLLDTWDRNRSTSGPTPWQIDDDDDDDDWKTGCWELTRLLFCFMHTWNLGSIQHLVSIIMLMESGCCQEVCDALTYMCVSLNIGIFNIFLVEK
jgi:hypothetical protein